MNEIKCPNCGTVFQISETNYETIVKQIRDKEFVKEINEREERYKIMDEIEHKIRVHYELIKEEIKPAKKQKEEK